MRFGDAMEKKKKKNAALGTVANTQVLKSDTVTWSSISLRSRSQSSGPATGMWEPSHCGQRLRQVLGSMCVWLRVSQCVRTGRESPVSQVRILWNHHNGGWARARGLLVPLSPRSPPKKDICQKEILRECWENYNPRNQCHASIYRWVLFDPCMDNPNSWPWHFTRCFLSNEAGGTCTPWVECSNLSSLTLWFHRVRCTPSQNMWGGGG